MTGTRDQLAARALCDLSIRFDQFQMFPTVLGTRLIAVGGGGEVRGPRLNGEVLPGGGDWLLATGRVARMDVRASIRTPDGEMLYVTGVGRAEILDDARDRFLAGETVADEGVRSRLALTFEAGDGAWGWLNGTVAIGVVSELSQRHIHYHVYELA
jgi:hypothetical protein